MSKIGAATSEGKDVAVFPADDVCLIFKEVARKGFTIVSRSKTGPEPPTRRKIRQYYSIKTTAKHSAPIEIRIVFPRDLMAGAGLKLWRWYPEAKRWENITKRFRSKYNMIIGETGDPIGSMFGVT